MKNFFMPLRLFFPAAVFLLLICQSAPAAGAETAEVKTAGKPLLLYTITNGGGAGQMAWHADNKKTESGHLQGPGAVLALNDELRLFADTLNQRLVLRNAESGEVLKIFELPQSNEVGLSFKPLIIDLADAGNGIIYAADEPNMAVWKIDLGKNWRGPKLKVDALIRLGSPADGAGGIEKAFVSQLGRIFADRNGVLYVIDLPRQCTVSFGPDGLKKFVYQGLTNGVPDKDGLLYHPIYYGDGAARDLEVFDSAGRMVDHFGRLAFDRPVCYIAPVGFDREDTLYVFADSEQKGPLAVRVYRKDKKQVFTGLPNLTAPVFASAPYWTGSAGSLEWAEFADETIKVYRLEL
jgi:hypothetical protein